MSASDTKHTPTPWVVNTSDAVPMIGIDLGDGGGLLPIVSTVHGPSKREAKANAAFIVLACNNFDALVAALEAARSETIKIAADLATWKHISEPVMPDTAAVYVRERVRRCIEKTADGSTALAVRLRTVADKLSAALQSARGSTT